MMTRTDSYCLPRKEVFVWPPTHVLVRWPTCAGVHSLGSCRLEQDWRHSSSISRACPIALDLFRSMTTHRTPSTVRAAHTALPPSGRNRSSMKPSQRVRSDVPATRPGQAANVTRSSSRQDSSKKWVTRMSPGKPTREGCDECGAKLIRTVLNYELAARSYTTVSVAGGTGFRVCLTDHGSQVSSAARLSAPA